MTTVKAFRQIQVSQALGREADDSMTLNDKELLIFTKSFRDLYEAGIPVNEILNQLRLTTPNEKFATALNLMISDIENGKLLSEAIGRFPNAFGQDYRSLVEAAERSGRWTRRRDKNGELRDGILEMLIRYIKRRNGTRERVKSGLIYPAVIGAVIIVALFALTFYALPALRQVFDQIGSSKKSIGTLTSALFWLSAMAEQYWWIVPFLAIGGGFALWYLWNFGNGQELWMKYQLRLKVVGPIFEKMNLGETMWLMGTLFSAGMTPQEVLTIVTESSRNSEISAALGEAKEYLFQGISFCDTLKRSHPIFGGHAYMVVSSAQKNGKLGSALQTYAEEQFEEVDQNIDRMVKLIEPAMLVVAGVIVGLIVVAYYSGLSALIGDLIPK
jgi:type II secretory pathway component PulF